MFDQIDVQLALFKKTLTSEEHIAVFDAFADHIKHSLKPIVEKNIPENFEHEHLLLKNLNPYSEYWIIKYLNFHTKCKPQRRFFKLKCRRMNFWCSLRFLFMFAEIAH